MSLFNIISPNNVTDDVAYKLPVKLCETGLFQVFQVACNIRGCIKQIFSYLFKLIIPLCSHVLLIITDK